MVANNSIVQEIHQKPSAGANQRTSGSEQKRGTSAQIQDTSNEALACLIDNLVDEINENASQIQAVAFGGKSYVEGSEDSILGGMFGAILSMSEDARKRHMLKDMLAELHYRTTSSGPLRLIAKTSKSSRSDVLQGAENALWVAEVGKSCIRDHITPIFVALEAISNVDMSSEDLVRRFDAIRNLVKHGASVALDMENTMAHACGDMQNKLNVLKGALA